MYPVKQEYNKLLARWKKAESIENELTTEHIKELTKISRELSNLLDTIINYTAPEALNGFEEDGDNE